MQQQFVILEGKQGEVDSLRAQLLEWKSKYEKMSHKSQESESTLYEVYELRKKIAAYEIEINRLRQENSGVINITMRTQIENELYNRIRM